MAAPALFAAWIALAGISGCGTPGAPLPPSLHLPQPASDLSATRAGNQVTLRWTNPKKTTDHQTIAPIAGQIEALICRASTDLQQPNPTKDSACQPLQTLSVLPGKQTVFSDTLPSALASGAPRPLFYTVELLNQRGRSAGPSAPAEALAGAAPPPIQDFFAQPRADGVALGWQADGSKAPVRLHRRLLTPAPPKHSDSAFGQQPAEPLERDLMVDAPGKRSTSGAKTEALDTDIRFGQHYEYTAQRVVFASIGGKKLELDGAISAPVLVDTTDRFPPAIPRGLAAVFSATTGSANSINSIDLSWEPDTETDLAGYIVYRSEDGHIWQRISPPQPVLVPAYQDTRVLSGHTYYYAVSSIDQSGNESQRSVPTTESVPANP
uniref:Putative Fibronectin, type III n=1 Tax=mine drainage metagenome TaxID=410659 RepID=E6PX53_9ZZZZ